MSAHLNQKPKIDILALGLGPANLSVFLVADIYPLVKKERKYIIVVIKGLLYIVNSIMKLLKIERLVCDWVDFDLNYHVLHYHFASDTKKEGQLPYGK